MLDFNKPFAIISSDRPGLSEKELERRRSILESIAEINGYGVIPVEDVWGEDRAHAFIIHGSPGKDGHPLAEYSRMLMHAFNQDAIILFDGSTARLITEGDCQVIGEPVPADDSENRVVLPSGESLKFV